MPGAIHLSFEKGAGKVDWLTLTRSDGSTSLVECPKQRIIPHDMVHYAVESLLDARGFLGRVRDGESARFTMEAEAESDGVERLVEVIQGDAWSGGTSSAQAVIALYGVTCDARQCPPLPIDAALVEAVRARVAALDAQWTALPVGGVMTLTL